jgi:uncharacterized protein (TIGR00255 family)
MTGFGKGETKLKKGKIIVEIKSVNHKFLDHTLKIPGSMMTVEDDIKELLHRKLKRGKVILSLVCEGAVLPSGRMNINRHIAARYFKELESLKKHLGLRSEIAAKDLLALPGVLDSETAGFGYKKLWPRIKKAIETALDNLVSDREKEGKAIYIDLMKHVKNIEKMLTVIKARAHLNTEEYRRRFSERIKDLTGGRPVDLGRLEMEVAIFAKNSDISEEISRLKSHLSNFVKTISSGGDVGKKIDFIAQELHRETNTVGSKASDFKISRNVIDIKGEIEKIREQAKNLE